MTIAEWLDAFDDVAKQLGFTIDPGEYAEAWRHFREASSPAEAIAAILSSRSQERKC